MPRIGVSCPNCGEMDAASCDNCGARFCCMPASGEDDNYCAECRPSCYDGPIMDAGCRSYPDRRPFHPPYPHFLYMGVELEVECGDMERAEVATAIARKHSANLLLKDDGSLSNGFEMVTGPFSLDVHKNVWPGILETAQQAGARSWRKKTTGLHVHLSRKFFTPLSIGKLLVFMNSDATKPHIVQLAGRESPDFAAIYKKQLKDAWNWEVRRNDRTGRYENLPRNGGLVPRGGSRYEILNLQNSNTIEIRIFKGTLHLGHVLANLEFCHAAAHWISDASMSACESWGEFWKYVQGQRKLYNNLTAYMSNSARSAEL